MEQDAVLVERSRAGDESAFATLYARHAEAVRRHLFTKMPAKLRKRLSVSDLLQETFATAFRRLSSYRGENAGSFRTWLKQIGVFKAREAARFHLDTAKRAVGSELSKHQRPATGALAVPGPTPSQHAMLAENEVKLDAALRRLPNDYEMILQLIHRHGFSISESAEQMNRSEDAMRKLYGRAVSRLADELESMRGVTRSEPDE